AENLPYVDGTDQLFLNSASLPLQTLLTMPPPGSAPTPMARAELEPIEIRHSLTTRNVLVRMLAEAYTDMVGKQRGVVASRVERAQAKNPAGSLLLADFFDPEFARIIVAQKLAGPLAIVADAYGRDDSAERSASVTTWFVAALESDLDVVRQRHGDLANAVAGIFADMAATAEAWATDVLDELEDE
ncbi:MAG: hypothetical protein M3Q98_00990, partial [Actinomycetota bacterium]|nr:hypothetical protein [Actinomycetota bacterium]